MRLLLTESDNRDDGLQKVRFKKRKIEKKNWLSESSRVGLTFRKREIKSQRE